MAKKQDFLDFYRANIERIYKFVYFRVGKQKELAEDLVQDIFVKVFEAFDRYDEKKSVSAWIFTIARNTVINHYAKKKADITLEEIEAEPIISIDARIDEVTRDDERRLYEALTKLDPEEARLIRMKHIEGWAYEDLADIFEKNPVTLRVQVSRGMKKLKKLL